MNFPLAGWPTTPTQPETLPPPCMGPWCRKTLASWPGRVFMGCPFGSETAGVGELGCPVEGEQYGCRAVLGGVPGRDRFRLKVALDGFEEEHAGVIGLMPG